MNEATTRRAYDELAARSSLPSAATSWDDALAAVDAAVESGGTVHGEAIRYYVGEGKPVPILAEQALQIGASSLEAAACLALAERTGDPADVIEYQRRRFQDLLTSRLPDLLGPASSDRASRLLWFLARYLGGGQALARRASVDSVDRSFAVDDLLEAAGFGWLLADLISRAHVES